MRDIYGTKLMESISTLTGSLEEIYDVHIDSSKRAEEIEPKYGWRQYRIVPNSETVVITIRPKDTIRTMEGFKIE